MSGYDSKTYIGFLGPLKRWQVLVNRYDLMLGHSSWLHFRPQNVDPNVGAEVTSQPLVVFWKMSSW